MANTGTITSSFVVGGLAFSGSISKSAEGHIGHIVAIPAGVAGLVNATTGADGLVTGHGLVATDIVNLHWTVAGVLKSRRGYTVDTASANAITFDEVPVPTGDTLPADNTAIIISKQVVVDTVFTGDLLSVLAMKFSEIGVADFFDAAGSELAVNLAKDGIYSWVTGQGFTNPLATDSLINVKVSNGSIVAQTFTLGILYESVS